MPVLGAVGRAGGLIAPAFAVAAFLAATVPLLLRSGVNIGGIRYVVAADDLMVSLRYAYQLGHGHGLVWNPGEYVQGFTNLGWTLLLSIPYALGVPLGIGPIVPRLTNLLLHAILIAAVAFGSWRRGRPIEAATAAVLIAGDASMVLWGAFGFETTLQALLLSLALLPLIWGNDSRFAPVWVALATIVRPDAGLVFMLVGAWSITRGRWRSVAAGAALIGAMLVWQRFYYGDWLPNTFALKAMTGAISARRGLAHIRAYAFSEFWALPLVLSPALLVAWRVWRGEKPPWFPALVVYAWVAAVVALGGDVFGWGRFFAPLVPVMALCAGGLLEDFARIAWSRGGISWATVAGLAFAASFAPHLAVLPPRIWYVGATLEDGKAAICLADAIRRLPLPPGTIIGVYWAGALPYFLPEARFHDFLGKTDHHIARTAARHGPPGHNKWDYAYSLGHVRPELIVTGGQFPDQSDDYYRVAAASDYGYHSALWLDPIFQSEYRPYRLVGPELPGPHWVYARSDINPGPIRLDAVACGR